MADTEYLITFTDNQKILASDTNSNNQYLSDKIDTQVGALQTSVDNKLASQSSTVTSQINTLTSTLNSSISSMNSTISSVKSTANSKLSSTSSSRWFKIYDPGTKRTLIIQWGEYQRAIRDYGTYTYTFPAAFSGTDYSIAVSASYKQTAGDKGSSVAIIDKYTTGFTYRNAFEQYNNGDWVRWIAIGY